MMVVGPFMVTLGQQFWYQLKACVQLQKEDVLSLT